MIKRCAFLSMDNLEGFVNDDGLACKPLLDLGWETSIISWRQKNVGWDDFDAVIIRSTWDYVADTEGFLAVLAEIDRSGAQLENNIDLVRWNIDKSYLQKLSSKGIEIVPTLWDTGFDRQKIKGYKTQLGTEEIVIKPTVSVNAYNTYRLDLKSSEAVINEVERQFVGQPYMVQPLMRGIIEEGEFSLFFFGGRYSHAILKAPKDQDFRVQEEHGGVIRPVQAGPSLINAAKKVMNVIAPSPLYARIDLVRSNTFRFAVMEVELIEPSLYLRMDPEAPLRFAQALDDWMNHR